MCGCGLCTCSHSYACTCVHAHVDARGQLECLPGSLSTASVRQDLSLNLHQFSPAGEAMSPRESPVSASLGYGYRYLPLLPALKWEQQTWTQVYRLVQPACYLRVISPTPHFKPHLRVVESDMFSQLLWHPGLVMEDETIFLHNEKNIKTWWRILSEFCCLNYCDSALPLSFLLALKGDMVVAWAFL